MPPMNEELLFKLVDGPHVLVFCFIYNFSIFYFVLVVGLTSVGHLSLLIFVHNEWFELIGVDHCLQGGKFSGGHCSLD